MKKFLILLTPVLLLAGCNKSVSPSEDTFSSEDSSVVVSSGEEEFRYDTLMYLDDVKIDLKQIYYVNREEQIDELFDYLEEHLEEYFDEYSEMFESLDFSLDETIFNYLETLKNMVKAYLSTNDLLIVPLSRYTYMSKYYLDNMVYEEGEMDLNYTYSVIDEVVEDADLLYDVSIIRFSKIYAEELKVNVSYELVSND